MFLETEPKESHHFRRSREQEPVKYKDSKLRSRQGPEKSLLFENAGPMLSDFPICLETLEILCKYSDF